jgi:hypothetical protein
LWLTSAASAAPKKLMEQTNFTARHFLIVQVDGLATLDDSNDPSPSSRSRFFSNGSLCSKFAKNRIGRPHSGIAKSNASTLARGANKQNHRLIPARPDSVAFLW